MIPATMLLRLDSTHMLEDVSVLVFLSGVCLRRSVWRTHHEVLVCLVYTQSLNQSAGKRMMV